MRPVSYSVTALPGIPLIKPGDDLASIIVAALDILEIQLSDGDVLVVTSKIVSKAEGRVVALESVQPGQEAIELASQTGKDPRLVELILRESLSISRTASHGAIIVEHRLGFICANAGIDQSNTEDGDHHALLLPVDPDASAKMIRDKLSAHYGVEVGIVISDSQGRPFRMGNIGVAVGVSGLPALLDLRGERDLFGRVLRISLQGYGDLVASAAQLVSGEGSEGRPIALIRGLSFPLVNGTALDLNRPADQDLYR